MTCMTREDGTMPYPQSNLGIYVLCECTQSWNFPAFPESACSVTAVMYVGMYTCRRGSLTCRQVVVWLTQALVHFPDSTMYCLGQIKASGHNAVSLSIVMLAGEQEHRKGGEIPRLHYAILRLPRLRGIYTLYHTAGSYHTVISGLDVDMMNIVIIM